MKGDFTRDTFHPANHYTRVLMQQGRVQLDADFNEQGSIVQYYLQTLAADLIGPHGGPEETLGFAIITDPKAFASMTDLYGRPLDQTLVKRLQQALGRGDFAIGPGRYYVAGQMCENEFPLLYSEQPGYPFEGTTMVEKLRGAGDFLIYLDAWERHISAVEDGLLRDVALGGPDTAGRAQLCWQVRVLLWHSDERNPDELLRALATPGYAALRARAKMPETGTDACTVDPESRYRGAENQLYRVEIHRPGPAGGESGASFKWSRDNGSVVFPLAAAPVTDASAGTTSVELLTLGRDEDLGLVVGGWVELIDDGYILRHDASPLLRVHSIDRDELLVVLEGLPGAGVGADNAAHPLLRRWDHGDTPNRDGALPVVESAQSVEDADGWLNLEDGVQVQFPAQFVQGAANYYRPGDYWLIPARTATGDVEWPGEVMLNPQPLPPRGEKHAYAPLAIGSVNADGIVTLRQPDLRKRITPLAT
jgi:hypothetical protein